MRCCICRGCVGYERNREKLRVNHVVLLSMNMMRGVESARSACIMGLIEPGKH